MHAKARECMRMHANALEYTRMQVHASSNECTRPSASNALTRPISRVMMWYSGKVKREREREREREIERE